MSNEAISSTANQPKFDLKKLLLRSAIPAITIISGCGNENRYMHTAPEVNREFTMKEEVLIILTPTQQKQLDNYFKENKAVTKPHKQTLGDEICQASVTYAKANGTFTGNPKLEFRNPGWLYIDDPSYCLVTYKGEDYQIPIRSTRATTMLLINPKTLRPFFEPIDFTPIVREYTL